MTAIQAPGRLADTVVGHLSLKLEERQELLESFEPGKRLEEVYARMQAEIEVLSVERKIRGRVKKQMKRILDDIQAGRFAREWVQECQAGQVSFKALRRQAAEHPIEEVGEKLRAMMPWIAEKALVDKAKN